ncbi:MAG: phosphoglucomutase, alpha-D-glucose phosphate-specific [Lysobacterales bacterium 69-70]|nr:alpha-D-glucose phosphate-specific phosphoglucomutase [Xanthomonadaceae bacterium]ODU33631.1 MAG: phosphoglucomutase, alpha-D-glucose phosphate-specific [Xanthomonadaceae bacterium SCN 69-320]ODV21924.1 MAG: phosphoglucomutase, alpha-D-glucose phosphate-specific [Xanthomonadaceae bacterium SCN 69-25]OJZ02827.1 MAG: phosphoglucomutase, alpha-D-glucose phosphate-specific [Xanthomonadales bacterium 69-70]
MNPPNPAQAGQRAGADQLVDVAELQRAYYALRPDPAEPGQRVAFGTSGHRGCAFDTTFNEAHVLAITQAICDYRRSNGIDGPLFLGIDTHALSQPAFDSALEVLAANGVETRIAAGGEFTPTPAISQAILVHNRGRERGLADGIVITPSHNPPQDGGFKYNPTHGGPADTAVTAAIEQRANALLQEGLASVRRLAPAQARAAATTREHDFIGAYVADLANVIDFDLIRASGLRLGVDPLGGAGLRYWQRIAADYGLALDVVNTQVDPQFGFMTLDWDGRIRMDPSSPPAMQSLIALRERFDVAFACDPDHDRHGIVTRSGGLMLPNNYLAVMADYLFTHRPDWPAAAGIGKTLVSSALIDRVAARLGRPLVETPVGFKWFVDGLCAGSLGMGAEESAGASFLRRDGGVWSTDKDGLAPALLSAEITARLGRDPYQRYRELCAELGEPHSSRRDAPATAEQKKKLSRLSPAQVSAREVAGEPVLQVLDKAPGNGAGIGGIKVVCANGWFAARPSGTEAIYKIYAESFRGEEHLEQILAEAQAVVDTTLNA